MKNKLIYGKAELSRIVSIEIENNKAIIFRELEDGSIEKTERVNRFWMLAHTKLDKSFIKLNGDLYYCWGRQFTDESEYHKFRAIYRNKDIFSIYNNQEALMVKDGYCMLQDMKPSDVSILSFDIETDGLVHHDKSRVFLISNTFRKQGKITKRIFCYDDYETDGDMIEDWCYWVGEMDPSIMCGHNIAGYDLPYLAHVANLTGHSLYLGRDNSEIKFDRNESKFRIDGTRDLHYRKSRIYGRNIIDTLFLSYKYDATAKKYESYGLKSIIETEGLTKKDRQFYDASLIKTNYKCPIEWEKIIAYCKDDADDGLLLFDLMIPPYWYMTHSIPKPFQLVIESATGSQINSIMIRSYLQEKHSIPKATDTEKYEGAVSYGNPGIFRNAYKVDVASLYPSIMLHYEVYDKVKDPNQNFLKMLQYFTTERLKNKKMFKDTKEPYYDALQDAQKRVINSSYGFMGTPGLCFNSIHNAAFVTEKGREILQKSIKWACGFELNHVAEKETKPDEDLIWIPSGENTGDYILINCDTDSITIAKKDQSELSEQERKDILDKINSLYPDRIRFEDDGYFDTVIVFKAKNYVLFDGKKVKSKGSAIKATTKEPALQNFIKEIINVMLFMKNPEDINHNCQDTYLQYVKEACNIEDIKRWSKRVTISSKTLESTRANETKVIDALEGTEFSEGDRVYLYFKPDDSLGLANNFDGSYNVDKMLKKVYDTVCVFETILPIKELFLNYSLKKNKKLLQELL